MLQYILNGSYKIWTYTKNKARFPSWLWSYITSQDETNVRNAVGLSKM